MIGPTSDVNITGKATIWHPTMQLRILNGVLQQMYLGTQIGPGEPMYVQEWRDVPNITETEGDQG